MDIMLIAMLPLLVPLAFMVAQAARRIKCPDCGEPLPLLMNPFTKTPRMWRAGGFLCARCGCETDMSGRKVMADTPPAPIPAFQWALLAVLILVGVGLVSAGILLGRRTPAAAVIAAPQSLDAPPPAMALPRPLPVR
jgi:hypothetical protein